MGTPRRPLEGPRCSLSAGDSAGDEVANWWALGRATSCRELSQESSDVICMALQRLGLRSTVVADPARFGPRHRGKRAVMAFIDLLISLGLMRCGDLCGRASDIIKQRPSAAQRVEEAARACELDRHRPAQGEGG